MGIGSLVPSQCSSIAMCAKLEVLGVGLRANPPLAPVCCPQEDGLSIIVFVTASDTQHSLVYLPVVCHTAKYELPDELWPAALKCLQEYLAE